MASNFLKVDNGVTIGRLTSDPVDGTNGDVYYNTTSNKFRKYENGAWSDLSGTGGGGSGTLFSESFSFKNGVIVATATTANLTLSSVMIGTTIDGQTLVAGDRVLVKNQTTTSENGVYRLFADATATALLDLTADITLSSVAIGAARNGSTFTLQVNPAAANPTNTVLADFTGSSSAIVLTITPNNGINNPNLQATALLDLTSDITFTSVAAGTGRNGDTITIQVLPAAANPGDSILFEFTGTSDNILITLTPNDGTNNGGTPVTITTANLVELINTGGVTGKTEIVTDLSSLRALQTASGGDATPFADGGEGDGQVATFSGGTDTPVNLTTAELVQLINTGSVGGKSVTVTDGSSLRTLQTAAGGDATNLADGGEGDGVLGTFSGGIDEGLQRHSTADTAEKLTEYIAYVGWNRYRDGNDLGNRIASGNNANVPTTNQLRAYYQANTLSTLSDPQSWLRMGVDVIPSKSFVVPSGVTQIIVKATGAGGGGGGGAGGDDNQSYGGGGGSGAAGCTPVFYLFTVTPGETITINLGTPGIPGRGGFGGNSGSTNRPGIDGGFGGTTTLSCTSFSAQFPGAEGGGGGQSYTTGFEPPGDNLAKVLSGTFANAGGEGGRAQTSTAGTSAQEVFYIGTAPLAGAGGAKGASGFNGSNFAGAGGGAGGTGLGIGPDGGAGGTHVTNGGGAGTGDVRNTGFPGNPAINPGAGGSGGGGSRGANAGGSIKGSWGTRGGWGGGGYVEFIWVN